MGLLAFIREVEWITFKASVSPKKLTARTRKYYEPSYCTVLEIELGV